MSKIYQALERIERVGADEVVVRAASANGEAHHHLPDASEYERLGGRVVQARTAAPFKTLLITAPDHGEGASTVALGLARALAERAGLSVLLVDANLRNPALAERLEVEGPAGLAEVLTGEASAASAIADVDVDGANLRLLAAGAAPVGAARLFGGERFERLLGELADMADVVVFDGAPVLPYADALTVASKVDRVILVTQADRTQRGHLERAKSELENVGGTILGVVLNRKASHAPPWLQRRLNL